MSFDVLSSSDRVQVILRSYNQWPFCYKNSEGHQEHASSSGLVMLCM